MTACSLCAGIDLVTYLHDRAQPDPFCGACGRRFAVRIIDVAPRPFWLEVRPSAEPNPEPEEIPR